MRRKRLSDEAIVEVFFEKVLKGLLFIREKEVEPSYWRR